MEISCSRAQFNNPVAGAWGFAPQDSRSADNSKNLNTDTCSHWLLKKAPTAHKVWFQVRALVDPLDSPSFSV